MVLLLAGLDGCQVSPAARGRESVPQVTEITIALPEPVDRDGVTLRHALESRRSVRTFTLRPLSETEISLLLWSAQGITHPDGYRTAPSAGALYPLELYVATAEAFYQYRSRGHRLVRRGSRDLREAMRRAAFGQETIGAAPAVFVLTAIYGRTSVKYGVDRAGRYAHMEAGHAAQNLLLQATALGLGAVPVGAFDDADLAAVLALPPDEAPLYLIPVGEPGR
jgi:SagB-type dehydrogenase family enzyme